MDDRGDAGERCGDPRTARSDPGRPGDDLNEIAKQSGVGMMLQEKNLPVKPEVEAACEFWGWTRCMSPTKASWWRSAPRRMRRRYWRRCVPIRWGAAAMIGTVHEDAHHFVQMTTGFGGRRIVDWLSGEQLPRIC
jgi:hydrogenase expression/formation protein HypE